MEGYICIILWEFMSYENYIFWRTTKGIVFVVQI